jgi:hypothetical protein
MLVDVELDAVLSKLVVCMENSLTKQFKGIANLFSNYKFFTLRWHNSHSNSGHRSGAARRTHLTISTSVFQPPPSVPTTPAKMTSQNLAVAADSQSLTCAPTFLPVAAIRNVTLEVA